MSDHAPPGLPNRAFRYIFLGGKGPGRAPGFHCCQLVRGSSIELQQIALRFKLHKAVTILYRFTERNNSDKSVRKDSFPRSIRSGCDLLPPALAVSNHMLLSISCSSCPLCKLSICHARAFVCALDYKTVPRVLGSNTVSSVVALVRSLCRTAALLSAHATGCTGASPLFSFEKLLSR
jgi:hypothetical protein